MPVLLGGLPHSVSAEIAQQFILVQEGQARAAIVIAAEAPPAAREAASVLQTVVRRMSGAELAVVDSPAAAGGLRPLFVGASAAPRSAGVEVAQDRDDRDYYVLRVTQDAVILAGNDAGERRGSVFAVYDLLGRLGCGWYGPDPLWQVIPERLTLALPCLDVRESPAFAMRCLGIIRDPVLKDAWRLTGRVLSFGSALKRLVPREVYAAEHPDYFGPGQVCFTHPEVIAIVTERLAEAIAAAQQAGVVPLSITQSDTGGFCNCARCRRAGNISARLLYFANAVASGLEADHAGRFRLSFIAYWYAHAAPRPRLAAAPGVTVLLVNEGDHVRPWDQAEPPWTRLFAKRSNNRELKAFHGWLETGVELGIYEWWIPGYRSEAWKRVPWVSGETALRNLRFWKKGGVDYVFYETWYELGDGFPLRWPLYYTAARGLWDPELSAEAIMAEACDRLYGPAAEPMRAYYSLLERAMAACRRRGGNWRLPPPEKVYGAAVSRRAGRLLEQALAAAPAGAIRLRVEAERSLWLRAGELLSDLRRPSLFSLR